MGDTWIVIEREFRERVLSKVFVLSTIAFPLFIAAILWLPQWMGHSMDGPGEHEIVVVHEAPEAVAAAFVERLEQAPAGSDVFRVERRAVALDEIESDLMGRVQEGQLDGFVWLGADFVETGQLRYFARNVTDQSALERMRAGATEAMREARMEEAGIDPASVEGLMSQAGLDTTRVTRDGAEDTDVGGAMMSALGVVLVLYMFIFMYGMQVMQSVHEEKSNRIAEILMSTIRPHALLGGKIFGVGAAAMVQMAIWGGLLALALSGWVPLDFDLPGLDLGLLALAVVFALLGFFLYAALFATLGAATRDQQDAQQMIWIVFAPLLVPMIAVGQLMSSPDGPLAVTLSWIPFTAPLAQPVRLALTDVSLFELIGSLVLLALTLIAVSWIAGRIYRVGMLRTGQRPPLRELWHWMRARTV